MRKLPLLLFACAFIVDSLAFYLFFEDNVTMAVVAHLLAVVFCCAGGLLRIRRELAAGEKSIKILPVLILLAVLIPGAVLGLIFTFAMGYGMPRQAEFFPVRVLPVPPLPFKPLELEESLSYADGGLFDVLRHSKDVDKRLTTVRATTRMTPQKAMPLLQLAMRDPIDDVRLLAFSVRDKIESKINADITAYNEQLDGKETNVSNDAKADLYRRLAYAYWELVYLDLVEGDLREFVLERVLENAGLSASLVQNRSLSVLVGRVYLARGELESAASAFADAVAQGASPGAMASYVAEIGFLRRDFPALIEQLATVPAFVRDRDPMRDVCLQWQVET